MKTAAMTEPNEVEKLRPLSGFVCCNLRDVLLLTYLHAVTKNQGMGVPHG